MEKLNKSDNLKFNNYNKNSLTKPSEGIIISKIADYQTSISTFSTKTITNQLSTLELKGKEKKNKDKKHVEFNPFITVINIQSYKKENFIGEKDKNNNEYKKVKKCVLCNII